MSTMVNAAVGVAALDGALTWRRAGESLQRLAQQGAGVKGAVQPEAMGRHKGDCGR
ncbi:hypothetical protein SAMN05444172_7751 [Burkholderia sp. GAS332]|nr:hypothetical protein SAMN05444172_7751 [Burkholderia sp. GAS332]